jgi:hypothetical protein
LASHPGSNASKLSDSLVNKRYYLTIRLDADPKREFRKKTVAGEQLLRLPFRLFPKCLRQNNSSGGEHEISEK